MSDNLNAKSVITMDNKSYTKGAEEVKNSTIGMDNITQSFNGSMVKSITSANLYTKAIGFVTSEAFKMAKSHMELEKSLAKVNTLLGVGRKELNQYGRELESIAISSGVGAQELTEGFYDALSAGVDTAESLEFMATAAQLARAGFTDVTTSVDGLTTVINAWGLETSKANEIADVFVKTQAEGKITVDEIGSSIANVAPLAAELGISYQEVSAAMATMTAQGIPAAQSVTQMRSAFAELSNDSSKANEVLLEISGKTFSQLQDEGMSVNDVIELMSVEATRTNTSLNNMFSSIEAGGYALATTGRNAESYAKNLKSIENSAGSTEEAHNKATDTLGDNLDKLSGLLKQKFTPAVQSASDTLNEMSKQAIINIETSNRIAEATESATEEMEAYTRRIKIAEKTYGTYSDQVKNATTEMWDFINSLEETKKQEEALYNARAKALLEPPASDLQEDERQKEAERQAELEKQRQAEALEIKKDFNEKVKQQEIEHLEFMKSLKGISNEDIAALDRAFRARQMEEQLAYWEDPIFNGQYEEEAAQLRLDIARFEIEETARLNDQMLKQDQDYKKSMEAQDKKHNEASKKYREQYNKDHEYSIKVFESAAKGLLNGRISSLGDMINVMAAETAAFAGSKAIDHTIQGFSDKARGASYASNPATASLAPAAFAASQENFAAAAKFGGIAGVAAGVAGATGGRSEGDYESSDGASATEPIDDDTVDDVVGGQEDDKTIIIQGLDYLIKPLEKELKNKYNVQLTARPKQGYK